MRLSQPSIHSLSSFPIASRTSWDGGRVSEPPVTRQLQTAIAEHRDRMRPATAGALVGGLSAIASTALLEQLLLRSGGHRDVLLALGERVSMGRAVGVEGRIFGAAMIVVAGAIVGALFASITRHLRRYRPLVIWSVIVSYALCIGTYAFVLPRFAPAMAEAVPFSVAGVVTLAYALLVTLELPLRRRAAQPFEQG